MENVTYLIGAGASCQAMPLVTSMKKRMSFLFSLLSGRYLSSNHFTLNSITNPLYVKYQKIIVDVLIHKTPDTYAKKLWLNGSHDDLKLLKEFLNLYFIFEQNKDKSIFQNEPNFKDKELNEIFNAINIVLDDRYDVFLATYLEKRDNTLKLPKNVNIISWNYDNQFEITLHTYLYRLKNEEVIKSLSITDVLNNKNFSIDDSNIIKLNGNSQYLSSENEVLTFETKIKELIELDKKTLDLTNINFAWENTDEQNIIIENAKSIMQKTNKLVIIGYSFPNFNRDIDKALIASLQNVSEINIQVPDENDEYDKIKDRIQNITHFHPTWFRHRKDKDQFYIP